MSQSGPPILPNGESEMPTSRDTDRQHVDEVVKLADDGLRDASTALRKARLKIANAEKLYAARRARV